MDVPPHDQVGARGRPRPRCRLAAVQQVVRVAQAFDQRRPILRERLAHELRGILKNAGATWVDQSVKVSPANGWTLITSRNPGDLDAFVGAIEDQLTA